MVEFIVLSLRFCYGALLSRLLEFSAIQISSSYYYYHYSLLKRLDESGVGCHMGGHFTGALAYVDDITLLMTKKINKISICMFKYF